MNILLHFDLLGWEWGIWGHLTIYYIEKLLIGSVGVDLIAFGLHAKISTSIALKPAKLRSRSQEPQVFTRTDICENITTICT